MLSASIVYDVVVEVLRNVVRRRSRPLSSRMISIRNANWATESVAVTITVPPAGSPTSRLVESTANNGDQSAPSR